MADQGDHWPNDDFLRGAKAATARRSLRGAAEAVTVIVVLGISHVGSRSGDRPNVPGLSAVA
jgi:hypothetical protein